MDPSNHKESGAVAQPVGFVSADYVVYHKPISFTYSDIFSLPATSF